MDSPQGDADVLQTYAETSHKALIGRFIVAIGVALMIGPAVAYLLGWANMPLMVAVLTTLASVPFGIVLVMVGWHVFTAWSCCVYDRRQGLLTIRSFSSLGPLARVIPPNFLESVTGLTMQKMGRVHEETYPLDSFEAVLLERQSFRARSSGGAHVSYAVQLRPADGETLTVDTLDVLSDGRTKAEQVAEFLGLKVEEVNMPERS